PVSWPDTLAATLGPDDDTRRLPPAAPLTIHFNQPMDPAAADSPLTLAPAVAGRLSWNAAATQLTFTPDAPLRQNATYRLLLHPGLASASGLTFAEAPAWRITTADLPRMVQRTPLGSALTSRLPSIRLRFNTDMDTAAVLAALQVDPPVAFDHNWEGSTLILTPQQPLAYDTLYRFALADTAVSTANLHLPTTYDWEYRLAPITLRIAHVSGAANNRALSLRFNYAVDPASVESALVVEPPLAGSLAWNPAGDVATFMPATLPPPNTTYTFQFNRPLQDAFGDALPAPPPASFTTPPPVLSTLPAGSDVSPSSAIRITFDRLVDEAAAEAGLTVSPPVTGTLRWDETTLIFEPAADLAPYTNYTVSLATSVTGRDGETLFLQPYTWSFTTGAVRKIATFGAGPNAQVLDANGRRAVQYTVNNANLDDVSFDLYQLTLPQFLDRYASGFRGTAGWEPLRPISTENAPLVASWAAPTDSPGFGYYRDVREVRVPADVPPGLYILSLSAGRLEDQLILVLTSYTVAVKQAENQVVAWVTDINGDPVPAADVAVYARSGAVIAQGTADASGVFRADLNRDPEPLIVVAGVAADRTASGLTWEWRTDSAAVFDWWRPRPTTQDTAVHLYTERPIYQPGQTVHFKAVIRRDDDAVLSLLPAGTAVTARLRDARNNVVQTLDLQTNPFGTVHGSFQLAAGAMLGDYAVEISIPEAGARAASVHRQLFKVQDYQKPDYEVRVSTDAIAYVDGDTVEVTIDSRYFFGEPVANANVVVNLFHVAPTNWWEDPAEARDFTWHDGYREPRRGRTDENGRFTLTLRAEASSSYRYYNSGEWGSSVAQNLWGIEATIDDGSHQTASGHAIVRVFSAAERVLLEPTGYFQQPGQPFAVTARVLTVAGDPVSGRELTISLRRWRSSSSAYTEEVQSAQMTTGADGRASLPFTIAEPGHYQLRVTGTDARGNAIAYHDWIAAFSNSDAFGGWAGSSSALRVSADAADYAPGDTARLLIESQFAGPALLTFERGTTRRTQLVQLAPPVTAVSVTIQPDDAPNIYVTVNAWQAQDTTLEGDVWSSLADSQLFQATAELRVPVTDKTLTVTITPDRDTYAPRDAATFTVRVTNGRGEPVSAEVSLGVVDEAIYALSGELAGPIFDAFYFERGNIVRTYDALAPSRYLGLGGGGGGGGGDLAVSPRADFPDTAAWYPTLQTDWNGEATVTMTLPDSLTSWRLTAVAATADTQVGEATAHITTTQPILIRPILPTILTAGDTLHLTALIHNNTQRPQTLTVAITVNQLQLTINHSPSQTLTLPPNTTRPLGWTATAESAGDAELTLIATVDGETADAIRLPLTIQPLAVPDVATQVGQFQGELSTAVDMPAGALPLSEVRIELSRSIAGSLLEGLEYLTGFPYGCVEQTMSRALPNAVVGRAFFQLGIGNPTLQADLPAQVNASLQRLYGYQHNDGGWGWWYDDSSHDYQTAWVIFGLATMREAGYEVDPGVIDRGVAWLNENLETMDVRTRAYALYSMAVADQPNADATIRLLDDTTTLDTFSLAGLALALDAVGEREMAQGVLDALAETAVTTDGLVYWRGSGEDGHYYRNDDGHGDGHRNPHAHRNGHQFAN
ncbi:MAG: Ig-like domain-containing protein, partial [Anaerolineales bacterium]|nr:Ig-like domain-containing protein [Anaerolineales bacterium]